MKITRRSVPVKAAINKLPAGIKPAGTPVKDYAEELASAVCKSLTDNGYICEYKVSTKSIVFTVAVDTNADIDINFTLPLSAIVPEATVSADMATVVDKIMNLAPLTSPGTDVDLTAEVTSTTKICADEYRQYHDPEILERQIEDITAEYEARKAAGNLSEDEAWAFEQEIQEYKDELRFAYEDQEYDNTDILGADDSAEDSCFATLWTAYIDDVYRCACCGKKFPAGHGSVYLDGYEPDGMHFIFRYTKENRVGNSINYDPYNLPEEDRTGGIFKVVVGKDSDEEGYHWLNFCRNCWPKLTSMSPDEIYAKYGDSSIQSASVMCSTDMKVTNYLNDFGDATVEALWNGYGVKGNYEITGDSIAVYFYSTFRTQKPWTHVTRTYDELVETWGNDPDVAAERFTDEVMVRLDDISDEENIEGATGVEDLDDKDPILGSYKDDEAYKKLLEYDYILDTSDDGCVIKFSDGDPYATFRFVPASEEDVAAGLDEWLIYADGDLINERLDYYPTNYDEAVKTAIRYFWSHY